MDPEEPTGRTLDEREAGPMFGAVKASDILPGDVNSIEKNGKLLRKGSVAAFIANAKAIDAEGTPPEVRRACEADLRDLVPVLVEVGVFEVFAVRSSRVQAIMDEVLSPTSGPRV
jgi:hypothetical protein